jgi:hypothetical protein
VPGDQVKTATNGVEVRRHNEHTRTGRQPQNEIIKIKELTLKN